jgi:hypothetical protein
VESLGCQEIRVRLAADTVFRVSRHYTWTDVGKRRRNCLVDEAFLYNPSNFVGGSHGQA